MEILGIDVLSAVGGAAASAITFGIRSVMIAPVKAATDRARFIRGLSVIFPRKPFDGLWEVTWHVNGSRLANENTDQVSIHAVLGNVTFTTNTVLLDGGKEKCVFVGKLSERTLTGRWYDPKDEGRGYFGVFQVTLHGSLNHGSGYWSGWSSNGQVQSNKMTLKRLG
ncbi:hypothetical protein [Novosphingobium sp. AP12]|uniref:hypothetical protein n=1 Tax=Novosphingobium sp. AP12 TaxID=1144305 RepID=UPI000272107E|nr:hypothetical protein [Novosphingobium sp. AP12]EJL22433.1 hypothetical protein PMI02_04665 [Novosphingobium sp. AP12]